MAEIFLKATADNTLVLNPREAFMRQFDFGSSWTHIRLGMFASFTDAADTNGTYISETIALNSAFDRVTWGIKNVSSEAVPGTTGANFIGLSNESGHSSILNASTNVVQTGDNGGGDVTSAYGVSWDATADFVTTTNGVPMLISSPGASAASSAYAFFWGLDILLADLGGATQTAAVKVSRGSAGTAAVTVSDLRSAMNTFPNASGVATRNFHDGGTPIDIPDGFFLRMPFINNRIRVHCMGVTLLA